MYRVVQFPKYNSRNRIVVILFFLFIPVFVHAQEVDSTVSVEQDNGDNSNTHFHDASKGHPTIYFLQKELQPNGGGPDSIQWRKLPDSTLSRISRDDNFWYVNYIFAKQKQELEQKSRFTEQPLFQTIVWVVIIGAFVAFVVIYLSNSNVTLFRPKSRVIQGEDENGPETGNIFEINYEREIDKAAREANYRLAVRLLFLRSLTHLSNKNIIDYKQDCTNFDYLVQLHSTNYYTDFFRLTRNYEYCWYGQFDVDPEKYGVIKNEFENFDSRLK
jgi:hypothetical protein